METFGLERKFVRNAGAFFCASDFPERGETALFVWHDATQHMELQEGPVAGEYVYDDLEGRAAQRRQLGELVGSDKRRNTSPAQPPYRKWPTMSGILPSTMKIVGVRDITSIMMRSSRQTLPNGE